MDKTDELILDLLKGNARMSFEELGQAIGMSRVGAKKRVAKLEKVPVLFTAGTQAGRVLNGSGTIKSAACR